VKAVHDCPRLPRVGLHGFPQRGELSMVEPGRFAGRTPEPLGASVAGEKPLRGPGGKCMFRSEAHGSGRGSAGDVVQLEVRVGGDPDHTMAFPKGKPGELRVVEVYRQLGSLSRTEVPRRVEGIRLDKHPPLVLQRQWRTRADFLEAAISDQHRLFNGAAGSRGGSRGQQGAARDSLLLITTC
jgi:hypothetical protein